MTTGRRDRDSAASFVSSWAAGAGVFTTATLAAWYVESRGVAGISAVGRVYIIVGVAVSAIAGWAVGRGVPRFPAFVGASAVAVPTALFALWRWSAGSGWRSVVVPAVFWAVEGAISAWVARRAYGARRSTTYATT